MVKKSYIQRVCVCVVGVGLWALLGVSVASPQNQIVNMADLLQGGWGGFHFHGQQESDKAGQSVSGIGDFNGDGYEDVALGIPGGMVPALHAGKVGVVLGTANEVGTDRVLTFNDLNGENGYRIFGEATYDQCGWSVAGAGDFNGNGYADLIIGAPSTATGGKAYLLFGGPNINHNNGAINLRDIDGNNGIIFVGANPDDQTGYSVSSAGDLNGDGYDDLLIGAPGAEDGGVVYVVYGTSGTLGENGIFQLADLDGNNGIKIVASREQAQLGTSVSGVGDTDGDGYDDFVLGAPQKSYWGGFRAGAAIFLRGGPQGIGSAGTALALNELQPHQGTIFASPISRANLGMSVAGVGDINGDGYNDLLLNAPGVNVPGVQGHHGAMYVVYGPPPQYETTPWINIDDLNSAQRILIAGAPSWGVLGNIQSGAGDQNRNGYADILSAIPSSEWYRGIVSLSRGPMVNQDACGIFDLDTEHEWIMRGRSPDRLGSAIACAGDFNGNGTLDFIIGAISSHEGGGGYLVHGPPVAASGSWWVRSPAGNSPRQAVGKTGQGNHSIPFGRMWIDYQNGMGPEGDTSWTRVNLFQREVSIENFPANTVPAQVAWQLDTDRVSWSNARVTLHYYEHELVGLSESGLTIYTAPSLSGPWSAVPTLIRHLDRNLLVGIIHQGGVLAIGGNSTETMTPTITTTPTTTLTPTPTPCRMDNLALRFDGVNDLVQLTNCLVTLPADNFTVELWCRPDHINHAMTLFSRYDSNLVAIRIGIRTDNRFFCEVGLPKRTIISSFTARQATWTHVATTLESGTLRLYINGTLQAETSGAGMTYTSEPALVGALGPIAAPSEFFAGTIDEIRLWSRARTAAEIFASRSVALMGMEQDLLGYWNFDEPSGQIVYNLAQPSCPGTLGMTDNPDAADPIRELSLLCLGAPAVTYTPHPLNTPTFTPTPDLTAEPTPTRCRSNDYALSFDGENDVVTLGNSFLLQPAEAFTIELWCRPDWEHDGVLFSRWDETTGGTAYKLGYRAWDRRFYWHVLPLLQPVVTDPVPSSADWVHVAASFNDTQRTGRVEIMLNGIAGPHATGAVYSPVTTKTMLGCSLSRGFPVNPFKGKIDEVRFWNVVRSMPEVLLLKDLSLPLGISGLVGYWTMDQPPMQIIIDSSGSGLHGYLGLTNQVCPEDPEWVLSGQLFCRVTPTGTVPVFQPSTPTVTLTTTPTHTPIPERPLCTPAPSAPASPVLPQGTPHTPTPVAPQNTPTPTELQHSPTPTFTISPTVTPTPNLDINNDGEIDKQDLVLWLTMYREGYDVSGDFNRDGVLNFYDLLAISMNWKQLR